MSEDEKMIGRVIEFAHRVETFEPWERLSDNELVTLTTESLVNLVEHWEFRIACLEQNQQGAALSAEEGDPVDPAEVARFDRMLAFARQRLARVQSVIAARGPH